VPAEFARGSRLLVRQQIAISACARIIRQIAVVVITVVVAENATMKTMSVVVRETVAAEVLPTKVRFANVTKAHSVSEMASAEAAPEMAASDATTPEMAASDGTTAEMAASAPVTPTTAAASGQRCCRQSGKDESDRGESGEYHVA
jgi:hypothetical protein